MSIVIPLGVTTPDTSYSDMAAGSDPESVEASPAVAEKNSYSNHNYGSTQHHGYRGLPYADHNYGAPPPPTPPASPPPQTIIARVELNRLRCQRYDENSEDSDSSSEDENIPWCHCSLTQDGFIIACENCRRLDRRKVIRLQRRKQENVSGGESSATESGDEEVSPSTVSYTATQHTPTSITLTVNRVKRSKPKKRKRSTEKVRNAPKAKKIKAFREGSRRSMRMKNSLSEAHALDENTAEGWENRIRLWTDQYEEAFANQYSADVQNLLELHRLTVKDSVGKNAVLDTINKTELACNNTILGSQMQLQLGKVTRVQRHRKILRAARDLTADMLIIEYRGKVMLRQQFEVNGHFFKRPYPFVLFYPKFNEVEMCVDARTFGNDARFIRRSCAPNAEVRHMIADGMIHLCIYAITNIPKDSEVTIGFDYEYSSCKYKVDCACHKGNQNCPVQKHNQGSMEPPVGAETRRRKARRKEWEMELELNHASDDNSNQQQDEPTECKEQLEAPAQNPTSDIEEGLVDEAGIKLEENEESEMDEHLRAQNKLSREQRKMEAIMQVFENLEKRKKRREQVVEHSTSQPSVDTSQPSVDTSPETPTTHVEEVKVEPTADEPLATGAGTPQIVPAGVGTRRTSQLGEQVPEKPVKPPAPKTTKPRPKNRFSRYRSSSAQRLRRQRQASSQSEPTPVVSVEEGTVGAVTLQDPTVAEGIVNTGVPAVESTSGIAVITQANRTNVKYPKTKRYLVSEWLNDKVERPECPYDRPLRITTDPTVLATTLNMLPGLSHSPHICTTPKHYIRFGSPFTPEKRRQRVVCDGNYGSCKKRWIRQAMDEAMVQIPHTPDAETEPPTFYQSSDASNFPDLPPNTDMSLELITPLKKRKSRYLSDASVSDLPGACSPLSAPASVSDTVMSSPTVVTPCTLFPGEEEKKNEYSVPCSPLHSLAASRCNTPLQFENISSPETSPVHRPEPLSPEPPLRTDYDQSRTGLSDLSLLPGLDTPPFQVMGVNDVSLSDCADQLSNAALTFPCDTDAGITGKSSDIHSPIKNTEQAFRTEFNLIYACSPLNSNLRDLTPTHRLEGPYRGLENRAGCVSDRKASQSERGFGEAVYSSPLGDSGFNRQNHGLLAETLQGSLSPQADRQSLYPEGNTTPQQNPPQKKKVSLLEYRKRQQEAKGSGSKSDSLDSCRTSSAGGTPTRRGSDCSSTQTPTNGDFAAVSRSSHRPSSPPSGFSSPVHPSMPQIEDASPTDSSSGKNATLSATSTSKSRDSMSTRWMVPTSVERLREDRGMLERVLRRVEIGSIKRTGDERGTLDRVLRRVETGAADSVREKDADSVDSDGPEAQGSSRTKGSPIHSPQRYSHSPSRYNHQLLQVQSESHSGEPHTLPQQSMSPYRTHSSSNVSSAHAQGYIYRSSSQILGQSGSQSQPDSSLAGAPLYSSPIHSTSADTSVVQYIGSSGYHSSQQHSASVLHTFSNTQQKTNSASSHSTAASPLQNTSKNVTTDSTLPRPPSPANSTVSQTARPCQSGLRTLNPTSSGQPLHSGAKVTTAASSQHYRSSTVVTQYQPTQVQSTSLRTQPSTY